MSTKFAGHRGQKIAYEVFGEGAPVILQHGFLDNRHCWTRHGYVAGLAEHFTVITIDSLGHGESDKSVGSVFYERKARSGDVVAVMNQENIDRAHYVGYSMGGWMGMGMINYFPNRLISLTLGGWNPSVSHASPNQTEGMDINQFLELAKAYAPDMTAWVTEVVKPALSDCMSAFAVQDISEEVLLKHSIPVHFLIGRDDYYAYESVVALHEKIQNASLSVVPGDHVGALEAHSSDSLSAILNFLKGIG